jgi:NADH-quinone oxidoreductase subunit F
MESVDLTYVETALAKCGRERESVIPILQSLQEHYGYLPESALRRVCELSEITPSSISGVSTFYDMFRHSPVGRVIVRVCRGTACHVTGAERVEDALRLRLQIPEGKNTDVEREYTVESVACLGCCTLAPVVRMDQNT